MRTIKFRGKDKEGKWHYGNFAETNCGEQCILENDLTWTDDGFHTNEFDRLVKVNENTVGQFTGLFDKNEAEIYEGDILKIYYYGKSKVFGFVKFDNCRFYIQDDELDFRLEPKIPMSNMFDKYEFEVIGNVHDNPELIQCTKSRPSTSVSAT